MAERQTHQLEGLATARSWRFESSLPHQSLIGKPGGLRASSGEGTFLARASLLLFLLAVVVGASGCLVTAGDGKQYECTFYVDDPSHTLHCFPIVPSGTPGAFKPAPK